MVHLILIALYYAGSEAALYLSARNWVLHTASPLVMVAHIGGFLGLIFIGQRHAMRKSRVFPVALLLVAFLTSLVEYVVARTMYLEKFDADFFLLPANYDGILVSALFALCTRLFIAALLLYALRHLARSQHVHR